MGFFSDFTGGSSRRDIRQSTAGANSALVDGLARARGDTQDGYDRSLGYLSDQYNQGRVEIEQGNTRALADLDLGYNTARDDTNSGYDRAVGATEDYLGRTENILKPFVESGGQYQGLLDNALGVNGTDAQSSFYNDYADNDPFREYRDELANKSLESQFNANGLGGSGRLAKAVSRASLERGTQDHNRYVDRITDQASRGGQFASNLANITTNAGNRIADYNAGQGRDLASLATNYGRDRASRNASNGVALGNFDYGYGQDQSNLATGLANSFANLETNNSRSVSNNILGEGRAVAGTRGDLMNNLTGLAGAVTKGFAPSKDGSSAFGNMANGIGNMANGIGRRFQSVNRIS